MGAVDTLLVIDTLFRQKKVEDLLGLADDTRCKIVFVSSAHEAGKKLIALGSVGAILRYKV